MEGATSMTIRN